jgi:drug/metabolite transporter (DMT)-like permease
MVLMALAVTLWAALEALAATMIRRYSPYQVVWTRYAVHLGFMIAVWGWREPAKLWRTRRPMFQIARSLLMLGMPASYVLARRLGVHTNELMSIFWLSPLLIIVIAAALLKEHVSAAQWLAAALGFTGVVFMLEPGALPAWRLWLAPFMMGLTFAAYVAMTRSLRSETTRANLFYTALGVFVLLSPFMPGIWVRPTLGDLAILIAVGLIGWVGLFVLDRMAAVAPVSVSAQFAFVQVPIALGTSWVVHGDKPDLLEFTGIILIGVTAAYAWTLQRKADHGDIGERAA